MNPSPTTHFWVSLSRTVINAHFNGFHLRLSFCFFPPRRQILIRSVHLQNLPPGVKGTGVHPTARTEGLARSARRGLERVPLLPDSHNRMYEGGWWGIGFRG